MAERSPARRPAHTEHDDASGDGPRIRIRNAGSAIRDPHLERHDGISGAPAFDRMIHEPVRLGMLSALAVNDVMSFNELKRILDTTDGNLSVHSRKLEEAEYVTCTKSFQDRVPRTDYRITSTGRRALEHYLGHMAALIQTVRDG